MLKGHKHSKKTKERIGKMSKRMWQTKDMTERNRKTSEKLRGENNPTKRPEVRKKISEALKGNKNNLGHTHSEETKKKMSEAKIGEKNYRWNPNRDEVRHDRRNDGEYKQWRKRVYKRDSFKCKINNKDCSGKIMAHHILNWADFLELRYEVNNGITLCHAHHPNGRAKEKEFEELFISLVQVLSV